MRIYDVHKMLDEGVPSEARFMFPEIVAHLEAPHEISKRILCLFGLRRSGKTVLLRQSIRYLLERGISPDNIHYLEMEPGDDFEALYDYANPRAKKGVYFFVDEIGNAELFVNRAQILFDALTEAYGAKMVLTGTNSLAVWLTGTTALFDRSTIIRVSHLSFYEHCKFVIKTTDPSAEDLRQYIINGGFFFSDAVSEANYIEQSIVSPLVRTVAIDSTEAWFNNSQDYNWRSIAREVLLLSARTITNADLAGVARISEDFLSLGMAENTAVKTQFLEYMQFKTTRSSLWMPQTEVSALLHFLEMLGVILKVPNKSPFCERFKWYVKVPFLRSELTAQLAGYTDRELVLKGPLLGTLLEGLFVSEWEMANGKDSVSFIRHRLADGSVYEIDLVDDAQRQLIEIKASEEQASRYTGFYKLQEYLGQECHGYERRILTMQDIPFIYSLGERAYDSADGK